MSVSNKSKNYREPTEVMRNKREQRCENKKGMWLGVDEEKGEFMSHIGKFHQVSATGSSTLEYSKDAGVFGTYLGKSITLVQHRSGPSGPKCPQSSPTGSETLATHLKYQDLFL